MISHRGDIQTLVEHLGDSVGSRRAIGATNAREEFKQNTFASHIVFGLRYAERGKSQKDRDSEYYFFHDHII